MHQSVKLARGPIRKHKEICLLQKNGNKGTAKSPRDKGLNESIPQIKPFAKGNDKNIHLDPPLDSGRRRSVSVTPFGASIADLTSEEERDERKMRRTVRVQTLVQKLKTHADSSFLKKISQKTDNTEMKSMKPSEMLELNKNKMSKINENEKEDVDEEDGEDYDDEGEEDEDGDNISKSNKNESSNVDTKQSNREKSDKGDLNYNQDPYRIELKLIAADSIHQTSKQKSHKNGIGLLKERLNEVQYESPQSVSRANSKSGLPNVDNGAIKTAITLERANSRNLSNNKKYSKLKDLIEKEVLDQVLTQLTVRWQGEVLNIVVYYQAREDRLKINVFCFNE